MHYSTGRITHTMHCCLGPAHNPHLCCRADYPVRNVQDGQTRDIWLQMSEGTFCRRTDGTDEPRVQSVCASCQDWLLLVLTGLSSCPDSP